MESGMTALWPLRTATAQGELGYGVISNRHIAPRAGLPYTRGATEMNGRQSHSEQNETICQDSHGKAKVWGLLRSYWVV